MRDSAIICLLFTFSTYRPSFRKPHKRKYYRFPTHIIEYTDELYKLACESVNTDELITYRSDGRTWSLKLEGGDNIIRFWENARAHNYRQFIVRTLRYIKC